ncbi:hypothetical protein SASPL_101938 [Salvia splendens]|uniref:RNase H type-1 domain-containing protein n=1 Tax=Salvia splendens TaxID=180675 RepID=A0A8X8YQY6_SALSN|nr:hypothetical protein SASPL_101938 [Salvia splendens]
MKRFETPQPHIQQIEETEVSNLNRGDRKTLRSGSEQQQNKKKGEADRTKLNHSGEGNSGPKPSMALVLRQGVATQKNNDPVTFQPDSIKKIGQSAEWAISAKALGRSQWKSSAPTVRFNFPKQRRNVTGQTRAIRWVPPQPGWIKLNTDGSFLGAALMAGGGGVVRNEQGRILGGFAEPFRAGSAKEAELMALIRGLEIAITLGNNIWVEIDTQEVVNMLEKGSQGAAQNRHLMIDIRNKFRGRNVKISHIWREGNKVADSLAKQGRQRDHQITFDQDTAPPLAKALARLDQLGIPRGWRREH